MKAPDKIYLEKSLSFPDKFHSHWYKEDIVGNGVEYIRKDLLLEWAKELTSEPYDRTTESARKHHIAHYLLEKYNSL